MRKITDIYKEYKIMPNLALHQLRVAAVARQICDSLDINVDKESVIVACLLHDMGNIIKSKLDYFPEFVEPKGLPYWKNVQDEYINKYGRDEDEATVKIAKEIGLSDEKVLFIHEIVAHLIKDDPKTVNADIASLICKYSDMRVGPKNIMPLRQRLEEWQKRDSRISIEYMEMTFSIFNKVENKIFAHSNIKPEDINDESVKDIIEELKNFEI